VSDDYTTYIFGLLYEIAFTGSDAAAVDEWYATNKSVEITYVIDWEDSLGAVRDTNQVRVFDTTFDISTPDAAYAFGVGATALAAAFAVLAF
jgi:hypothetical protein